MNIILMGYRCTGKTTVGRRLAERLGLTFRDTDEMVEQRLGRLIPRIVAEEGWQAFRDAERAVIEELAAAESGVIALGGGALCDRRNVSALKGKGLFIWLFAAAETIAVRMEKDEATGADRPSLTGIGSIEEAKLIMAQREPLYRSLADLSVDTAASDVEGVTQTIIEALRGRLATAAEPGGKERACPATPSVSCSR